MMKMQPISEKPEHKAVAVPLGEIQREIIQNDRRLEQIRIELSRPAQRNGDDAFAIFLSKEGAHAIDERTELREELGNLEKRQQFLRDALEQGQAQLDRIVGGISLNACRDIVRPVYVESLRKLLKALRQVCDCSAELLRIRDEVESAGYRTDHLPLATFTARVDRWQDEYGSAVQFYRRRVKEDFPELAKETE